TREDPLTEWEVMNHDATLRTHLARRKPAIRDNQRHPGGFSLIREHLTKHPEAHITDRSGKHMILDHAYDVQVLNHYGAGGLHERSGQLVQTILPLAGDTIVQPRQFALCFRAIRRAFHLP